MTAGELKELLQNVPNDRELRLLSDPEGNRTWGVYAVETDQKWNFDGEEAVHEVDVEEGFHGPDAEITDFDDVVLIIPCHI